MNELHKLNEKQKTELINIVALIALKADQLRAQTEQGTNIFVETTDYYLTDIQKDISNYLTAVRSGKL